MFHFNAQSVKEKWLEIVYDLDIICVDIICILETWIKTGDQSIYNLDGFKSYFSLRSVLRGSGCMIMASNNIRAIEIIVNSFSECIHICAVRLVRQSKSIILICVYREPKTCAYDTCKLFDHLRELCLPYKDVIIMGNINLPHCDWLQSSISATSSVNNNVKSLMREYDLQQIVTEPARGNNLLDAAIVSSRLHKSIADV